MPPDSDWTPVSIIGAPRSGTNMLRDVLTSFPELGTWPCDEINYIWRHCNRAYPTDALPPQLARPKVKAFIRRAFERLAGKQQLRVVVEKTCANCLRVDFVRAVIPEARFIHIVRDGRDAALSAVKRWKAPSDFGYILAKARYVPLTDVPYYALRFVWNRLYRLLSPKKRLRFWGPVFEGLPQALQQNSLLVCAALQWQACARSASEALARMPEDRVHTVRYEQFVQEPAERLAPILHSAGIQADEERIEAAVADVYPSRAGLWRTKMTPAAACDVEEAIGDTLHGLGYD